MPASLLTSHNRYYVNFWGRKDAYVLNKRPVSSGSRRALNVVVTPILTTSVTSRANLELSKCFMSESVDCVGIGILSIPFRQTRRADKSWRVLGRETTNNKRDKAHRSAKNDYCTCWVAEGVRTPPSSPIMCFSMTRRTAVTTVESSITWRRGRGL